MERKGMSIVRTHMLGLYGGAAPAEDLAQQPQLDETDNSASSAKLYLNRK